MREQAQSQDRDESLREVSSLTARLVESTGKGLDLAEANLSGLDLRGFDLRRANLNRACLHAANLSDANLSGASLVCPALERTIFRRTNFRHAYMHAFAAQVCDFRDADLSFLVDATGGLFHGCKLDGACMEGSVLNGVSFYQSSLKRTNGLSCCLQGASLNECLLGDACFEGAQVDQLVITKCSMERLNLNGVSGRGLVVQRARGADGLRFDGARLSSLKLDGIIGRDFSARSIQASGCVVQECQLPQADFSNAVLASSSWNDSHMDGTSFSRAVLDQASIRRSSFRGVDLSGAHAECMTAIETSFRGSRMNGITGRSILLRDCDLRASDLSQAYLYRAVITGDPPEAMCLAEVEFQDANLVQAYIAADLTRASMRNSKCAYARFNQSSFVDADLLGIALYQASLVKVDFTRARLGAVEPPFFVDRCVGLREALTALPSSEARESVLAYLDSMERILDLGRKGST
jgi:uncharacterized protein YjbI with pentapeptide repeats